MREGIKLVTLTVKEVPKGDVLADVVRVHHAHRAFAKPGDVVLVKIGIKKTYANVRPHDKKNEVCFDWATREKLGIEPDQEVNIVLKKASWWGEFRWAWGATDAMPRVAARLGLISLILGTAGAAMGIISLCR